MKTYKWPTAPSKDVHHHPSSGKCKSKLQWDITSRLSEWLKLTTQETTDVAGDAEKGEPSYTVGGNANWNSHSGKQDGGSSKVKNRTTLWSSNCTTRYLPEAYKNANLKGYMHPDVYSSIINNSQIMKRAQMLSTKAKLWKGPKCPQRDEWIKKVWYMCIYVD